MAWAKPVSLKIAPSCVSKLTRLIISKSFHTQGEPPKKILSTSNSHQIQFPGPQKQSHLIGINDSWVVRSAGDLWWWRNSSKLYAPSRNECSGQWLVNHIQWCVSRYISINTQKLLCRIIVSKVPETNYYWLTTVIAPILTILYIMLISSISTFIKVHP